MDSYQYSKKATEDEVKKAVNEESDSESEYEESDSEYESETESGSESDSESECATDEELDEYIAPKTATGQAEPDLTDILEKIAALKNRYYRAILKEFYPVCKWFKNNDDKIAAFFFPPGQKYDITDFKQAYLIRKIVDHTGPKQTIVRAFLDSVSDVSPLGMVRVKRGATIYYRIQVGRLTHIDDSESESESEYESDSE